MDFCINEAIRIISLHTGFFRNTLHLPGYTVENQLVYPTPAGLLTPVIVSFEGRQLQKISLKKLVRTRRGWATETTASRGRVEFWAPIGINQFIMVPIDAQGGRDVTITGLGTPPLLVNAGDVMVLEREYVDIIVNYCTHRLPLKIGGQPFADGSLALKDFYAEMAQRARYEGYKSPRYSLIRQQAPVAPTVAA